MSPGKIMRAEIYVSGRVQHVGFRWFTRNSAERLGLNCNPINLRDGRVFVIAEGHRAAIELLIKELWEGPTFASVENVYYTFMEPTGNMEGSSLQP
ncbi:TPA: acylphosphatase [Methanosarcinaceae archaeon]|nr:acylphosphatase [Methanosarcinaceae archaeon]